MSSKRKAKRSRKDPQSSLGPRKKKAKFVLNLEDCNMDEKEWKNQKRRFANKREEGLEYYQFPEFCEISSLSWETMPTSSVDLAGKYQIIFSRGVSSDYQESRTVNNSFLTLEVQNGELTGKATFENNSPQGDFRPMMFNAEFTLKSKGEEGQKKFLVHIQDDDTRETLEEIAEDIANGTPPIVRLRKIKARIPMPWQVGEDEDDWADLFGKLIPFDGVEEAEDLMEAYHKGNGSSDWLCKHKGLTPPVAKLIHDFVAWKPCPVMFLEPDDLVLDVDWLEDTGLEGGTMQQYLVARKVAEYFS